MGLSHLGVLCSALHRKHLDSESRGPDCLHPCQQRVWVQLTYGGIVGTILHGAVQEENRARDDGC